MICRILGLVFLVGLFSSHIAGCHKLENNEKESAAKDTSDFPFDLDIDIDLNRPDTGAGESSTASDAPVAGTDTFSDPPDTASENTVSVPSDTTAESRDTDSFAGGTAPETEGTETLLPNETDTDTGSNIKQGTDTSGQGTPTETETVADEDKMALSEVVFQQGTIAEYRVTMDPEDLARLEAEGNDEVYLPAALEIRGGELDETYAQIGFRHKGAWSLHHCFETGERSYEAECAKLSYKIKFDKYKPDGRLYGLKNDSICTPCPGMLPSFGNNWPTTCSTCSGSSRRGPHT